MRMALSSVRQSDGLSGGTTAVRGFLAAKSSNSAIHSCAYFSSCVFQYASASCSQNSVLLMAHQVHSKVKRGSWGSTGLKVQSKSLPRSEEHTSELQSL